MTMVKSSQNRATFLHEARKRSLKKTTEFFSGAPWIMQCAMAIATAHNDFDFSGLPQPEFMVAILHGTATTW